MRYGIAVWNYAQEGQSLAELIGEFADMGFTAVSISQRQLLGLHAGEADELRAVLEERDLVTTVHGACRLPAEHIRLIAGPLGDRLRSFTVDALMRTESRGSFYDVKAMAPVLEEVGRLPGEVAFGIEDFPLDQEALSCYRQDLAPLLANPKYGILVDIGHLNLRCTREGSAFRGMSPQEYLSRIPLRIVEAHIHDNLGEKDSHGHFGFGNLDFPRIAEALKAVGFDGISTIEIAPSFHGSTPQESKPLARQSLEIWRGLWEAQ